MLQRLGRARSAGGDTGTDPARAGAGDVGEPGGPAADAGQVAGPDGAGGTDGVGPATAVDAGAAGAASHDGTSETAAAEGATAAGQASADGAGTDGAGTDGAPRRRPGGGGGPAAKADPVRSAALPEDFSLPQQDPLRAFLLSQTGAVDISRLELASPALAALKAAGVVLVVPLVSSGELIGLLNLGPRLSERGYSADDRRLLSALAGYAAPAMRVGQLVRQQQAEARDRERIEQELKVAQLIQQQFLPKSLPDLPSWHVAAFYRPARTVGGDFYDFIPLPDGRLMVVIGDVTDKGVPAALVMASTHALLRGAAPRLISPGPVLAQVNDLLCADIPAHMFVTCLALVLDPATGQLEFANAGHDVPYVRTGGGVAELRARGMPLGLMPGMDYEEKTFQMRPGDSVLLHSDGLAEAHSPDREMFGFPRVAALVGESEAGEALIDACLAALAAFTGPDHEQEDDITLVTIERRHSAVYAEGQS
jgi:serine phosphatase RsbU (regulator of sigma subunit)